MKLQNLPKSKNIFDFLITFLIFDFLFLIFAFVPQGAKAQDASFYLLPSKGTYGIGETFLVNAYISARGISINAAQAKIYFPPDKIKVKNISKGDSIFTLWVQEPAFSNSKGEISFGGGLPSPGYIGESGKIFNVFFEAKAEGEAKVNFDKEIITANDPTGNNIFSSSQGAVFAISAKELPGVGKEPKPAGIDKEPPEPFEITVDNEGDAANPQPLLYFEAKDPSGISNYEIKIGEGDLFSVSLAKINPFRLSLQAVGRHKIIVKAKDKAGNYRESSAEIKVESIPVPEINVCPDTYIAGEEILYIEGTARANDTLILFLKSGEKLIKTWEIQGGEKGDWILREDGLFKSGIYKISARAKNQKGAISNPSRECAFSIILSGIQIGRWTIGYKNLVLLFIVILILILLGIFYFLFKIYQSKSRLKRETKDLKEKFEKEYNELESDIKRELEELKRIRGKREATQEEKKREEELLKNLADIKSVFEKELKDIEK